MSLYNFDSTDTNNIMRTKPQIDKLMVKFGIQEKMNNLFKYILANHTCEDLDIENKNISINSKNLKYSKTEFDYHKFQAPILNDNKTQIGYFALVVTNDSEIIDEYFVIN